MALDKIFKISVDDVVLGERQRSEMGDIEGLAFSLQHHGQLQPVIVLALPDGKWKLVAGERRWRAAKFLGWPEVSAVTKENCDETTIFEIELDENLRRKQLTWQEESKAVKKLHMLKQLQYGKAMPGRFNARTGWGLKDTAEALQMSTGYASETISLADALEQNPELAKESSKKMALFKHKQLQAGLRNPKISIDTHKAKLEDSFIFEDFLISGHTKVADQSVDFLVCDTAECLDIKKLAQICFRIAAPDSHGVAFMNMEQVATTKEMLRHHGFITAFSSIWHVKGTDSFVPILWFGKGVDIPASFQSHYSYAPDHAGIHSRSKSYKLMHNLITICSGKGGYVLETAGYGETVVKAAMAVGRHATSYSISEYVREKSIEALTAEHGKSIQMPEGDV